MLVPGTVLENEHGTCYVMKISTRCRTCTGDAASGMRDIGEDLVATLGGAAVRRAARKLLYLDTETTGLSAAPVRWLSWLGRFLRKGGFCYPAVFYADYDEVAAIAGITAFSVARVVTFNGKAFDMNFCKHVHIQPL